MVSVKKSTVILLVIVGILIVGAACFGGSFLGAKYFNDENKNENVLIAIMNFSGCDFNHYRLGVEKGEYKAVLCSDDKKYGGNGLNKRKTFKAVKKSAHGKECSILIKLPRFTGIYFIKKG